MLRLIRAKVKKTSGEEGKGSGGRYGSILLQEKKVWD